MDFRIWLFRSLLCLRGGRGPDYRKRGSLAALVLLMSLSAAAAQSGDSLLAAGHFEAAAQAYSDCLERANDSDDALLGARCMLGQGSARIMLGQLSQAEEDLAALVLLTEKYGFAQIRTSALIAQGRLYTYQARYQRADEVLAKAIAMAQQNGDPAAAGKAWITRSQIALERLTRPRFLAHLETAAQVAADVQEPSDKTRLLAAIASVALQSKSSGPLSNRAINIGSQSAAAALTLATRQGDERAMSLATGLLGEFYLAAGRLEDTMKMARTAVFYAQQLDAPELAYRWEWLTGRALRAQGKLAEAALAMDRSIDRLTQVRSGLLKGIRGRRTNFRELVGPLFQDHADILLRLSANAADGVVQQQMRSRARDVIEAFKSSELQDYFLDDCVVEVQQQQTMLDQLDPHTAVLYPILLRDRTEILISIGGHIHQFTVAVGEQQIARQAIQFRRSLESRRSNRYRAQAAQLYDWLLRPAAELLQAQRIDTIVFVPDGALRTVPMSALYDGEHFLVEQFALATTPGLNLTDPKPIARGKLTFLVNALTDAVQGYPALPSVEVELAALQQQFDAESITLLKNQDFISANIEQAIAARPYNIVHFASHGEFQANFSESFLLTYDGKLSMNKIEELMQLRRFSDEPVELLTLSACQTAAGDDRAALGLAGIAIKAGARSALGTLWFINDSAASQLIADFYQYLRQPQYSKAQALRLAQLNMIKDPRYNHPNFWAPFLLIGNWL